MIEGKTVSFDNLNKLRIFDKLRVKSLPATLLCPKK